MLRLLLLFIIVPTVEFYLLVELARRTNIVFALALTVVTGIVGSSLARSQGFRTFGKINRSLAEGQMPTDSLLDALMIFVAGALLLTPGILTDLFGLSLLIPPCRTLYKRLAGRYFKSRVRFQVTSPGQPPADDRTTGQTEVIDSYVVDD